MLRFEEVAMVNDEGEPSRFSNGFEGSQYRKPSGSVLSRCTV